MYVFFFFFFCLVYLCSKQRHLRHVTPRYGASPWTRQRSAATDRERRHLRMRRMPQKHLSNQRLELLHGVHQVSRASSTRHCPPGACQTRHPFLERGGKTVLAVLIIESVCPGSEASGILRIRPRSESGLLITNNCNIDFRHGRILVKPHKPKQECWLAWSCGKSEAIWDFLGVS